MEEEVEEGESPVVEPPGRVEEEPGAEAEEDFTCQEWVEPRILPDPGKPTQKQSKTTESNTSRTPRGPRTVWPAGPLVSSTRRE